MQFSAWLPDMDLPISMRDECRVQVNVHDGRTAQDMLVAKDPLPFTNRPHPTYTYYAEEGHCLYPNSDRGFVDYANNYTACCVTFLITSNALTDICVAVLLYSTSQEFSTDLYPILSQGKISPCFSDIAFPSTVRPFTTAVMSMLIFILFSASTFTGARDRRPNTRTRMT
jgi:hypothetical protein